MKAMFDFMSGLTDQGIDTNVPFKTLFDDQLDDFINASRKISENKSVSISELFAFVGQE
jgi:hypothetical protein